MVDAGPVNIKLTAEGISEVINAFKTLESAAARLEKLSRAATTIAKNESKARLEVAKTATIEAKAKADASKNAAKAEVSDRKNVLREFEKAEKEKTRIVARETREQERLARQLSSRMISDVRSTIGTAARLVTMGLSLAGGLSVANAFGREMSIQRSAARLSVASNVPGKPGEVISTGEAIASARRTAMQYNVKEEDVLEAQHAIVAKTGRGRLSANLAADVTRISKAESVDPKELGTAIGIAAAQNPSLTDKELVELMKILVAQGKVGSVELADMATVLPVAMAKAVKFEGNQGDNQVRLASLLQIAIKTTGSPEQAAIAIKHLPEDIVEHQKAFEAHGINIRGEGGRIRNINSLIADTLDKTKGNAFAMKGLFGERAGALTDALSATYLGAETNKKGTGRQAALDMLNEMNKLRLTDAQVQADLDTIMKTDAEKVSKAMNDLERVIGTKLVPHLTPLIESAGKLVPAFADLLDGLGKLVGWIAENPMEAAFAGLGIKVTESILAQVGGQIVGNAITKAITAAGGAGNFSIATLAIASAALITVGLAEAFGVADKAKEKGIGSAAGEADILGMAIDTYQKNPTEENAKKLAEAQKHAKTLDEIEERLYNEGKNRSITKSLSDKYLYPEKGAAFEQAESYYKNRLSLAVQEDKAAGLLQESAAKMQLEAAKQMNEAARNAFYSGGGRPISSPGPGPRSTSGANFNGGDPLQGD